MKDISSDHCVVGNTKLRNVHYVQECLANCQECLCRNASKGSFSRTWKVLEAYLSRAKYGDVVFVDVSGTLLNAGIVLLVFELLAGKPEENVLLAEFTPQEVGENFPTPRAGHEAIE